MQFRIATLVMMLLPAVYSAALPQASEVPSLPCHQQCIKDNPCPEGRPESCICRNSVRTKCMSICPEKIFLIPEKCDPKKCYEECMSQSYCTQQYPSSCYCANANIADCSSKCGTLATYFLCYPGPGQEVS